MRIRALVLSFVVVVSLLVASTLVLTSSAAQATFQQVDTEVPPGNPVIGDNRAGDIEPGDDTNYGLWALLATCLIGAGVLLVNIERWEKRRIEHRTVDQV